MVDFSQLLRKPAGEAKRPPILPAGDYEALIKSFEPGESRQKKTPFIRFNVGLTSWPNDAPAEWDEVDPETGKTHHYTQADVELGKRQLRTDFYLTEDALFRLDEFLRSLGIDPAGRSYEEILPEAIGQPVLVEVQQYLNQETNRTGNQVGKVVGLASKG